MSDKKILLAVGGCLLVLVLAFCAVVGGLGVWLYHQSGSWEWSFSLGGTATPVADLPTATPEPTLSPTEAVEVQTTIEETLAALKARQAPESDPVALARRLQHVTEVWATPASPPAHRVGDVAHFWVSNQDTNENFQVTARLAYLRPHVYFWVQEGVKYDQKALKRLVDTFEDKIYPTDRAFFGSEWTPGIDGDPHLYILYTRGVGSWVAGYFSSADEIPPFAHEYSNAHEMFVLNADNVNLSHEFTYGVLAHEFQHMIHWYHDRNETTWLNEGASELASLLNGYDVGGSDWAYARQPDTQLNAWSDPQQEDPSAHYGASFMFMAYFLGRYGEQATRTLIARPENGLESVDLTLKEIGAGEMADGLFADWAVANWLQDPSLDDGRYGYKTPGYTRQPWFQPQHEVKTCPDEGGDTVHQYGVDYIKITCRGDYTLRFQGASTVPLFPAAPHSGKFVFWTGYGDESDITLTRKFDLSGVSQATLRYWTWYDIEKDYDYAYVEASTDGRSWEILKTPSGTDTDPSGNSYGWGYTGVSGGGSQARWIEEQVDLSPYAGKTVWVRFEYVTDAAVNHVGMLLDDIRVPEVGYSADFEDGHDGWEGRGFVRVGRWLPQTFRLSLIDYSQGQPVVRPLVLGPDGTASVPLRLTGKPVVLVVSGTTRVTRQPAQYTWSVQSP
ncbi:MAG TPA: hypothetical protein ENJ54_04935 [Chloroflexi bacterium]|nr:hypothetical protein [Chloroflexota bacterium]